MPHLLKNSYGKEGGERKREEERKGGTKRKKGEMENFIPTKTCIIILCFLSRYYHFPHTDMYLKCISLYFKKCLLNIFVDKNKFILNNFLLLNSSKMISYYTYLFVTSFYVMSFF